MNESLDEPPIPVVVDGPPPRKGWHKLSWAVIVLLVVFIIALRFLPMATEEGPGEPRGSDLVLKVMEVQLRMQVGAHHLVTTEPAFRQALAAEPGGVKELYANAKKFNHGSAGQRLRFITVAGELAGPREALRQLEKFDAAVRTERIDLSADQRQARAILGALYADYAAGELGHPSVSEQEAELLQEQLGWFGELALHPRSHPVEPVEELAGAAGAAPAVVEVPALRESPERKRVLEAADRTFLAFLAAFAVLALLFLAGICASFVFALLWVGGKLRIGLEPGVAHGGVYAETFALWLALWLGLTLSATLLTDLHPVIRAGAAMLLSLLAICWPVLRGVPWRQVRHDIGWTLGRQPLLEPFYGVASYVINFPLAMVGFGLMLLLLLLQAQLLQWVHGDAAPAGAPPTHPVIEHLGGLDWPSRLGLLFLVAVIAPVVEETMFRGVLHRNLRETVLTHRPFASALVSASLVNFVFAAIHPQGLATIPVLMCLAYGFSLAREWRGTLIPAMCAHGLNNALVAMLAMALFG